MPCRPKLTPREEDAEIVYLDAIFRLVYPNLKSCPKCGKRAGFHRARKYKAYVCQWCGHLLSPLGGTAIAKSSTPLAKWRKAARMVARADKKITVHKLRGELGVTLKTAWRMRKILGEIETDPGNPLRPFFFG